MSRSKKSTAVLRGIGRFFAVIGVTLLALLIIVLGGIYLLCKGPSETARNMFVTSMLETSAMKFVPHLFLSAQEIQNIVDGNAVIETVASADTDAEFEKSDISVQPDAIELFDVAGSTFTGKMMVVHDPSRVSVATIPSFSESANGWTVEKFASSTHAVAAINGGGFSDLNGFGSGGLPTGFVIKNGKLIFGSDTTTGSMVGFDDKNHLVVGTMSAQAALSRGVRDALCYGPALIVDGEAAEVSGTSGGLNPRTVVGQRADGAVLLLVIDGRQPHSLGATYKDCIDVMLKYEAVNAGNLDGGCSTSMLYNGVVINSCSALRARYVPTAFVVK